ncbi:MAG: dihydroorotate dehydrogenase, partial [bacterium]
LVGDRIEDYIELAKVLDARDEISALEINASCPNVAHGYMAFSVDTGILSELTSRVRKVTKKPLIVKLSPNVTDIVPLAKAASDSGADILNIANTFLGMAIDIETRKSRLGRDYAGLSGRAIRPITLRLVHQAACSVKIPIIGTGGIYDSTDAIEFFIAGATAIGLGTVNLIFPNRASGILAGIKSYLDRKNVPLKELIGSYISAS